MPTPIPTATVRVRSESGSGEYYLADHGTHWTCTCADYIFRGMHAGNPGHVCKHIARATGHPSDDPAHRLTYRIADPDAEPGQDT